ncbi:MAG: caspase family protein [Saprospiraceae bacterium]|nr:caspase family protein [Saprospiraceae bacterium]HMW39638.1 caspase family protein [Saprospiraceae bacterium]HMX88737.1 caspase family protein [Saprospiraceae bacterium]HMZ38869.1 caspase family protein [Saprospiraceae bacterium]HNA65154.1 caspase family protein [Saprospiraceae bacterium]
MSDLLERYAIVLKRTIAMRFSTYSGKRFQFFLIPHFLILCFSLNAQQDSITEGSVNSRGGGVGSLRGNFSKQFKSIDKYALVVGISDYADPGITDLQFAHRDAKAFYDYLVSPDGGDIPSKNIRLLLNDHATMAAIDDALNWCRNTVKKGNRLFIYFAGHGDVEKQTLWQLGYLLAYDTPNGNYRNNAVRLDDINDLAKTLTIADTLESNVIIIMDACRAGKLIGTDTRGPSLTADQLSRNVANEARLLSCKPDQKSIEGTQWGGGRGLFSYHLVNGLYGAADESGDKYVTLEELKDYLKSKIKNSIESNGLTVNQNPVVQGNEDYKLGFVTEKGMAAISSEKEGASNTFATLGSRAIESAKMDSNVIFFTKAKEIIWKQLFESPERYDFDKFKEVKSDSLLWFLRKIAKDLKESPAHNSPKMDPSRNKLITDLEKTEKDVEFKLAYCRELAVFIHDQGQVKLNKYLTSNVEELQKRAYYSRNEEEFKKFADCFRLAAHLIDRTHPLYNKLLIKSYYFEGVSLRIKSLFDSVNQVSLIRRAIELQLSAQLLDDKTPFINNELGILYSALGHKNFKTAKNYYARSIDLSPKWNLPYVNLARLLYKQDSLDNAVQLCEKSIQLNSQYAIAYTVLGQCRNKQGNVLAAIENFNNSINLDPEHFLPYYNLADIYLEMDQFSRAEELYLKVEPRMKGLVNNLLTIEADGVADVIDRQVLMNGNPVIIFDSLQKRIELNPNDVEAQFALGMIYKSSGQYELAECAFQSVIRIDENYQDVLNQYAFLAMLKKDDQQAEYLFQKSILQGKSSWKSYLALGSIYEKWSEILNAEKYYRLAKDANSKHNRAWFNLAMMFEKNSRYLDAEMAYLDCQNAFPKKGALALMDFYKNMCEKNPGDWQWPYKLARMIHVCEECSESEKVTEHSNEPEFAELDFNVITFWSLEARRTICTQLLQNALRLNSSVQEKSFICLLLGQLFLESGNYKKADSILLIAAKQDSFHTDARKLLISIADSTNQLVHSYLSLEGLYQVSKLSYSQELLLARWRIYSGQFVSGEKNLNHLMKIGIGDKNEIYGLIALSARRSKRYKTALEYYSMLEGNQEMKAGVLYSKARIFAVQKKKKESVKWLNKSLEAGFDNVKILKYDPLWKGIFSVKEWRKYLSDHNIDTE